METEETITIVDEHGERRNLELIDKISLDGVNYVIVGSENSDKAYAYKAVVKNNETNYIALTEGSEFQKVLKKFNEA